MNRRLVVPIGVFVAAILIIIGGYIIFNPGTVDNTNTDNQSEDNYIVPTEKDISSFMPEIKLTSEELKRNAEVPFKVGKKYKYKTTSTMQMENVKCIDESGYRRYYQMLSQNPNSSSLNSSSLPPGCVLENETTTMSSETEFYVEKTETVEGKECYVVSAKTKIDTPKLKKGQVLGEGTENYEELMEEEKTLFYYDKKTGKTVKVETSMGGLKMTFTKDMAQFMIDIGSSGIGMGPSMFAQWMLSLDEGFRWVEKFEDKKSSGNEKRLAEIEYKVEGLENVNKRECFKVEITLKDKSAKKAEGTTPIEMTSFAWIDKEKRILVKQQMKVEGMMSAETNLISET